MLCERGTRSVILCGWLLLTAQTPAPTAAPAKPLRHLEYRFSVAVEGLQGYAYKPNKGVQTVDSNGHVATPEAGNGTMYVDILSVAPDGSLVISIAEKTSEDPRPRQAFSCNVYGNTSVLCPQMPGPSDAEWMLLGYLGRQFVDGAPWTADGHWQRTESSAQFESQENFTLVDAGNGNRVIVREDKKLTLHDGGFDTQTSQITVTYDRKMEVPDAVRAEVDTTGGDEANHASYSFTLTRDSFAKTKH